MRVVSTVFFGLAVLVNSAVYCVIHEVDARPIPGLPGFRTFVVAPEDIPFVYIKPGDGELKFVDVPINVVARDHFIISWWDNGVFRPIYDFKGVPKVQSTETGVMEDMDAEHVRRAFPLRVFSKMRKAALEQAKIKIEGNDER